jgi:hypothetical protein
MRYTVTWKRSAADQLAGIWKMKSRIKMKRRKWSTRKNKSKSRSTIP